MKPNKYSYLYVLQGYYCGSWSDLCAADQTLDGCREMKRDRKSYRDNEGGTYRIIKRRETIVVDA